MRTNVYVDGFNLYYGALRGQPYRWLDLLAYCQTLLHDDDHIFRIRYFTARVAAARNDKAKPDRQNVYLRALATLPNLSIHFGHFLTNQARMARADGRGLVDVIKTEEKGSDVNLASHLLVDASRDDCQIALVVSNDSDLTEPIALAQSEFGIQVGVALPVLNRNTNGTRRKPSVTLQREASFSRRIEDTARRRRQLWASQFTNPLTDAQGSFRKPTDW